MASPRLALDSLGNVDYLGAWEEETGLEKKQIVSRRCEKDICKDMEVNSSHFCARDASQTKKWKPWAKSDTERNQVFEGIYLFCSPWIHWVPSLMQAVRQVSGGQPLK